MDTATRQFRQFQRLNLILVNPHFIEPLSRISNAMKCQYVNQFRLETISTAL